MAVLRSALVLALVAPLAVTGENECKTFEQIYGNGKNLCEKLWDDSFEYVPKGAANYDLAYTMWWFTDGNPNDAVTTRRIDADLHPIVNNTDECHLDYFHHDDPQSFDNKFTECHPWEEKACCAKATVLSADTLRESYGPAYDWNRCGHMSDECERFLVQEACLYECDVNAGLFRKYPPGSTDPDANEWQLYKMPIQGEYCDAFYRACKDQMFLSCDGNEGSWFACEKFVEDEEDSGSDLSGGAIAAIVVSLLVACCLASGLCMVIRRERMGDPMFKPIDMSSSRSDSFGGAQQELPQTRSVTRV